MTGFSNLRSNWVNAANWVKRVRIRSISVLWTRREIESSPNNRNRNKPAPGRHPAGIGHLRKPSSVGFVSSVVVPIRLPDGAGHLRTPTDTWATRRHTRAHAGDLRKRLWKPPEAIILSMKREFNPNGSSASLASLPSVSRSVRSIFPINSNRSVPHPHAVHAISRPIRPYPTEIVENAGKNPRVDLRTSVTFVFPRPSLFSSVSSCSMPFQPDRIADQSIWR